MAELADELEYQYEICTLFDIDSSGKNVISGPAFPGHRFSSFFYFSN
jgi:hypothetical protein